MAKNVETEYNIHTVANDFQGTLASKSGYHASEDKIQVYEAANIEPEYIVTYVEENEKINIESENGKTKHLIIGMKTDDFPAYPESNGDISYIMLPTKELVTMINKTISSIAK